MTNKPTQISQFTLKTMLWLVGVVSFYAMVAALRQQEDVGRTQAIIVLAVAFVLVIGGVLFLVKS